MDKKKTLSAFLRILLSLIKVRIAFAFTCTEQRSQAEILRYFNNLIRIRANEFLQAFFYAKASSKREENRFLLESTSSPSEEISIENADKSTALCRRTRPKGERTEFS